MLNAKDIEKSITNPMELELKNIENIKRISSTSSQNISKITLELKYGTDMLDTISKVRDQINLISDLPDNMEKPIIKRQEPFEMVASVIIYGPQDIQTLTNLAHQFKPRIT